MLKNLRRPFLDPLRGITYVVYIILLQYCMPYGQGFWASIIFLQYHMPYGQNNRIIEQDRKSKSIPRSGYSIVGQSRKSQIHTA